MNMTLMRRRRRVRVSKYIILVNTVGAIVGAELSYLYFIYIKQLLKASKWRRDSVFISYYIRYLSANTLYSLHIV